MLYFTEFTQHYVVGMWVVNILVFWILISCLLVSLNLKNKFIYIFVQSNKKAKIRNRYNQVLHLTQDTTWESDKNTRKHNIQESQETSPFSAGDHKAAMNRQDSMTDTKHKKTKRIHKKTPPWNGQYQFE